MPRGMLMLALLQAATNGRERKHEIKKEVNK
jgi:hypothetical protein